MVRDNLVLGATAGVVATVVMDVLVPMARVLGFKVLPAWDAAAGVLLSRDLGGTASWLFVGWVAHLLAGGIAGTVLSYLFVLTGQRFALLKGLGLGGALWLFSLGVLLPALGISPELRFNAAATIFGLVSLSVWGVVAAALLAFYLRQEFRP